MSRRSRKSGRTPNIPEVTLRRYGVNTPAEKPSGKKSAGRSGFNPDYSHVAKDLRRIAVLGATFIALLVGLSFILP